MTHPVVTRQATHADAADIAALHARVFGPGRFARTAYRIREAERVPTEPMTPFCRVALLNERIIAAVKFTEIRIGGEPGAVLLGPLVVDPEFAGQGFGRRLVGEGLEAARAAGRRGALLVGDEPYYGRFGFTRVPPGRIMLPGPVNPLRLLWAPLVGDASTQPMAGLVTAA